MTRAEAFQRVLADHALLRTLIGEVVACTRKEDRDKQPFRLRQALTTLRAALEDHLAYEETTLVPLLKKANAWGPVQAAHMAKDHDGQRAVLLALTEEAGNGVRSVDSLADEIAWFVQSFECDMREEETTLLGTEAHCADRSP